VRRESSGRQAQIDREFVRRRALTAQKVKVARDMYAAREHTVEEIAKTIGVSRKTVYRHLAD